MTRSNRTVNRTVCRTCAALTLALAFAAAPVTVATGQEPFLRGDVNSDGRLSVSDFLQYRRWVLDGQTPPSCFDAADIDDNGVHNLTEGIQLAHFMYVGVGVGSVSAPSAPYPDLGVDPTDDDGVPCASYEVSVPEETDDTIRVGDVTGGPGERVQIPVYVSSAAAVEGFQLVVRYDPAVFTPDSRLTDSDDEAWFAEVFGGSAYTLEEMRQAYFRIRPLEEEGVLVVALIPSVQFEPVALPPNEEHLVFHIVGNIAPDAPAGAEVVIEPTNGPGALGVTSLGLRNELTHLGTARYVSIEPQLEGGILAIVPDQLFVRGDADDDADVNITDAQFSLNYLFLGGPVPPCLDAADANDDAKIDISDPVVTLNFLFLGGVALPAPSPDPGVDPTRDDPFGCRGGPAS